MKLKNYLILFLIAILLAGCGKKENDKIKFGVIMPLTGNVASLGVPCLKGIQLAIDDFNEHKLPSEPTIQLITEDSKASPTNSVSSLQKLKTIDNIKIVIGPLTSGEVIAVASIANREHIVIISPGASASAISSLGDYIFRNELSDSIGSVYQAKLAIEKISYKNIACVFINNDYGVGLYKDFKFTYEKSGGKIVLEEAFLPGSSDFRTIIAKIKKKSVDAIFIVAIDEIVDFVRQKKELGLKVPLYTTPIFENQEYINKLGQLAEGIIYTYYGQYDPFSNNSKIKSFVSAYHNRFSSFPTYYSALGYDAANIILQALKNVDFDETKLKNSLFKIQNFPGITGKTSFDKHGDVQKPVSLKIVRNGRFIFYDNSK